MNDAFDYDLWKLDSGEPETVNCPECGGYGEMQYYSDDNSSTCRTCHGAGEITEAEAQHLLATLRAES